MTCKCVALQQLLACFALKISQSIETAVDSADAGLQG